MKKSLYLLAVVLIATSCATGYYAPHNVNQFGAQTQVVLNQANFRIVRHLEVVVDINNSNLKRADVEKSAYAELLRRANLTGSQALINVVIEEVRRESYSFGRIATNIKQHVAARATVIEFIDANGNSIKSIATQGTAPISTEKVANENTSAAIPKTEGNIQTVKRKTEPDSVEIAEMAKEEKNKYYIMSLFKSNNFNYDKLSEAKQYFDIQSLLNEKAKYSLKGLQRLSAEHDEYFNRFARIL